jgi:hypothetical protein
MANPTNPFNWQMPQSTDLVTDLPADFETFGQAVATSMADLLGGTTGQVLSKASNTDMDFTWVTSDDANAIQNSIVDAKGDLIAASAADTPARLAVGADYTIVQALSTEATGLRYTGGWTTYTPTWGVTSGTAPAIGNGVLTGGWRRIGSVVEFYITLTAGSTTTYGNNIYTLSLPVAAFDSTYNIGYPSAILNDGVTWYTNYYGSGVASGFNDKFVVYAMSDGSTAWSSTGPFTFGTNDKIIIQGRYRVA